MSSKFYSYKLLLFLLIEICLIDFIFNNDYIQRFKLVYL